MTPCSLAACMPKTSWCLHAVLFSIVIVKKLPVVCAGAITRKPDRGRYGLHLECTHLLRNPSLQQAADVQGIFQACQVMFAWYIVAVCNLHTPGMRQRVLSRRPAGFP